MAHAEDALELLLPDAAVNVMSRARDVTHFLRLLSDDARPARASSVGIDWERARTELERHDIQRLARAITDLLRHHLNAVSSGESFAWYGDTALGVQGAWRLLDDFRDEMPWLAGVPEPGEDALGVAERLLESLTRIEASASEVSLWRARLARWTHGSVAAEKLHRAELESGAPNPMSVPVLRACIDGVASSLLDRGAAREARSWLAQHSATVAGNARLRHLLAWTKLVLGDFTGAKSALVGLRPWSGPLPRALLELRAHHPEWLPCLAGRAPMESSRESSRDPAREPAGDARNERIELAPIRSRAAVGAVLLCVFQFRPGRSTRTILADSAPALRESLMSWMRDREDACAVSTTLEHLLVVSAQCTVLHRDGEARLHGVLGRDMTLALALVPILDDDGEVAGWLHMEFEHHLLPSTPRLKSLASTWSAEWTRVASAEEPFVRSKPARIDEDVSLAGEVESDDDLGSEIFQRAVHELGFKTSQRRWWGFSVEGSEARLVITGGDGSKLDASPPGEQRGLRRAILTGGTVMFEEPVPKLSISAQAGSGVVLPLLAAQRVCGLLAIESSRRRDFHASDLERYASVVEWAGLALRLAQFRRWHRDEFGFDLWFDPTRPDFRRFAGSLLFAARSRTPVVLFGPAGSGKLVLTRWLHFESGGASRPLKVFSCGLGPARGGLSGMLDSVRGGSLVLDDVEDLDGGMQEELLRWLEGVDSAREREDAGSEAGVDLDSDAEEARAPRVFATTRSGLAEALRVGKLRSDLAARLDRLQLRVPALKERREDIPPLIECLARRFAAEEGLSAPTFADEALALLWRQRWEGNLRELENVVYKLVLLRPLEGNSARGAITPEQVTRIARMFDLELTRKLNSRHPLRADLLAALRATRLHGGRINKTRAAQYLGWDPDTLVARMTDLGISDECELSADAWHEESAHISEPSRPAAENAPIEPGSERAMQRDARGPAPLLSVATDEGRSSAEDR
jgi:transcriptional regulator with AAA-type ATPase domain